MIYYVEGKLALCEKNLAVVDVNGVGFSVSTSMYTIGRRYELGNGVEQNIETAIEWYQKAAEAGNKKAADRLAELTGN